VHVARAVRLRARTLVKADGVTPAFLTPLTASAGVALQNMRLYLELSRGAAGANAKQ
jgi:hypothetical protein